MNKRFFTLSLTLLFALVFAVSPAFANSAPLEGKLPWII